MTVYWNQQAWSDSTEPYPDAVLNALHDPEIGADDRSVALLVRAILDLTGLRFDVQTRLLTSLEPGEESRSPTHQESETVIAEKLAKELAKHAPDDSTASSRHRARWDAVKAKSKAAWAKVNDDKDEEASKAAEIADNDVDECVRAILKEHSSDIVLLGEMCFWRFWSGWLRDDDIDEKLSQGPANADDEMSDQALAALLRAIRESVLQLSAARR
jgi:hypothetical protein